MRRRAARRDRPARHRRPPWARRSRLPTPTLPVVRRSRRGDGRCRGSTRVAQLRSDGVVNRLVTVDYSANGGLDDQWYQEGCFELADDEALVLEARLPTRTCRALSLSLTDAVLLHHRLGERAEQPQPPPSGDRRRRRAAGRGGDRRSRRPQLARHHRSPFRRRSSAAGRGAARAPRSPSNGCRRPRSISCFPSARRASRPNSAPATIRARQVGVQLRSRW